MNKKTNMKAVKNVTTTLLNMQPKISELHPDIVQHPVFLSRINIINRETLDITEVEGFKKATEYFEDMIKRRTTAHQCLLMLRNPYYLTFFGFIKNDLSTEDYNELLGECWTEEEFPNADIDVPVSVSAEWFRDADKKVLMNDSEYEYYLNLPDSFEIYRGVPEGKTPNGMSWTRKYDKAKWFANRFGSGYVIKGIAKKKDVLTFFNRRGEEEVVIEAKNILNKENMKD